MASYASTVTSTPESHTGSLIPPSSVASNLSGGAAGDEGDQISLEEREARLAALLAESQLAHAELSERMMDVYTQQGEKLVVLRLMEKTLSSQAGSLLKRLQSEEQSTSSLSSIIKRYKSEHKKLLAKIANPKWEIAHHYHMTVLEHHLGHRQPHVLDVAELLPGHLRIYSLARVSSLYKRALMYYSAKSKADRNSVSESIQESYKRLREVRRDMKEIQRMMDLMKVHMKKQSLELADSREGATMGGPGGIVRRIPKMERQDSGERTFDPTTPSAGGESPLAGAAAADFANPPPLQSATSASFALHASSPSTASAGRRPGSGPGPIGSGSGGPGGMDAMMRQRRRMLGMGAGGPGAGQSGGPGRSTGPGVSGRGAPGGVGMGLGTPVSGTSSAGETKPSSDPLAPLNPDAIALPTDGTAFTPLATTTASPATLLSPSSLATTSSSSSSSSSSSQSNYRMKYFKTLNLAPKLDFLGTNLPTSMSSEEARKDMQESYNMDMKGIHGLLSSLEATGKASKEKAQQLTMLQQYRKRMGVESLPQPHFDAAIGSGLGALDAPASPMASAFSEMSDSDNEGPDGEGRRGGGIAGALRGRGSPSASPRMGEGEGAPSLNDFSLDSPRDGTASPSNANSRPGSASAGGNVSTPHPQDSLTRPQSTQRPGVCFLSLPCHLRPVRVLPFAREARA